MGMVKSSVSRIIIKVRDPSKSEPSAVVRATNSKLLGKKILEVSKKFRVELENT